MENLKEIIRKPTVFEKKLFKGFRFYKMCDYITSRNDRLDVLMTLDYEKPKKPKQIVDDL